METIAEDLYNNMVVKGITKSSSHKDMTLFGAEMPNFGPALDEHDKWTAQPMYYWCLEKGHKAYNCPQQKAGKPRVDKKANNNNESNNNSNNNEGNNNSNGG
eukprot:jgi/Psemu1/25456/gm1.25456_g